MPTVAALHAGSDHVLAYELGLLGPTSSLTCQPHCPHGPQGTWRSSTAVTQSDGRGVKQAFERGVEASQTGCVCAALHYQSRPLREGNREEGPSQPMDYHEYILSCRQDAMPHLDVAVQEATLLILQPAHTHAAANSVVLSIVGGCGKGTPCGASCQCPEQRGGHFKSMEQAAVMKPTSCWTAVLQTPP